MTVGARTAADRLGETQGDPARAAEVMPEEQSPGTVAAVPGETEGLKASAATR